MWATAWGFAFLLLQAPSAADADPRAEGLRALEQNNYAAAIEALTKAAAADPKDYSIRFNLALAQSLAGRDSEAIEEYRRTLELEPNLYQANLNLGILLLRNRKPEQAIPVLERARTVKPDEFRPALYLADAQLATGKDEAAGESYAAALKLDPKSAAAELGQGRSLARRGQLDAAAPHFEAAAKLDPSYADALLELGELYEKDKRLPDAVALYTRFPDNTAAQERAGQILLSTGKKAEAIPLLEAAVARSPSSANRLALATAYFGNKETEKGVKVLNDALTADPRNFDLRMLAGRALRDLKQYPNASKQFLAAANIKPDSVEAWNELAASLVLGDNYEPAISALDKLKSMGAETPSHLYLRAIMLDKLKQLPEALDYYRRFLAASQEKFPDEEFKARQRARIIQRELSKR